MKKITMWTINSGFLFLIICLSGCGNTPLVSRPAIEIGGMMILNHTSAPVYDIQLKVGNSNKLIHCSYLPAGGKFTSGFPLKSYQGNPVTATWKTAEGNTLSTQPAYVRLPEKIDFNHMYFAIAEFKPAGVVDVYLQPDNRR